MKETYRSTNLRPPAIRDVKGNMYPGSMEMPSVPEMNDGQPMMYPNHEEKSAVMYQSHDNSQSLYTTNEDTLQKDPENSSEKSDSRKQIKSNGSGRVPYNYVNMIVECMLQSPTRKVLLSEIYRHVKTNYKDMTDKGVDWQNGIRHNLSLNDCFEKDVRNPNGKGYFWTIAQKNLPFFEAGDFRRRWTQCRTRRQRDKIEKRKQSARRPMASPNYAGFNVENPPPNLNAFQNASPSPNVSSFHNKKDSNYFDRRRVCLATETAPFAINHPSPHSVPPPMHSPSFNGFYNNGPPNFFQRQCLGNFHEQNTLSPHQAYFTYPGYVDSCGGHQSPYSSQMQSSTQQGQTSENVSVDGSHRLPEQHSQDRVRTYQDHSVNTIMNRLV